MNHNYKYDRQSIKAESVCNSKICTPFLMILFIIFSPVCIALTHMCSERGGGGGGGCWHLCVCKCMWVSMHVCIHVCVWV